MPVILPPSSYDEWLDPAEQPDPLKALLRSCPSEELHAYPVMLGAGIHCGDLLVVDRSLEAKNGNVVVAVLDGDLTVKRLYKRDGVIRLLRKTKSTSL